MSKPMENRVAHKTPNPRTGLDRSQQPRQKDVPSRHEKAEVAKEDHTEARTRISDELRAREDKPAKLAKESHR